MEGTCPPNGGQKRTWIEIKMTSKKKLFRLKCDGCGNWFEVMRIPQYNKRSKHHFCSQKCINIHMEARNLTNCNREIKTIWNISAIRKAWILYNRLEDGYYEKREEKIKINNTGKKYTRSKVNRLSISDRYKYIKEAREMLNDN